MDPEKLAEVVFASVKTYCDARLNKQMEAVVGPLLLRIAELEARAPEPGPAGNDGRDGVDGQNGKDGADGINGKDGADGLHGKDGVNGENGRDGADAVLDPELLQATVEKAVAAIPKPQDGKDADPAVIAKMVADAVAAVPRPADGKDADPEVITMMVAKAVSEIPRPKDGTEGKDGRDGRDAVDGKDGRDGRDGKDAADGKDGRDGKDGEPGRDAAEIDVLEDINPQRSYPRGVWAKHHGATIRATRNTDVLPEDGDVVAAGWQYIIDPSVRHDTVQSKEDPRSFEVRDIAASGKVISKSTFWIPVPIYQGTFTEGKTYSVGDLVTWGGSMWHCETPTQEKPGEKSGEGASWRLAVKKGRDVSNFEAPK